MLAKSLQSKLTEMRQSARRNSASSAYGPDNAQYAPPVAPGHESAMIGANNEGGEPFNMMHKRQGSGALTPMGSSVVESSSAMAPRRIGQLPPLNKAKKNVGFASGSDNEGGSISLTVKGNQGPG